MTRLDDVVLTWVTNLKVSHHRTIPPLEYYCFILKQDC